MEKGERRDVDECTITVFDACPYMQMTPWLAVAYMQIRTIPCLSNH